MPEQHRTAVDLVITGASEVLTCAADAPDLVGRIVDAGVAIDAGHIVAVGDVGRYAGSRTVDAKGGVVLPGFVDAHTHVVFGGSRVDEYVARVAGRQPPAGVPIGIVGTTDATRACSVAELVEQAGERVREMVDQGTTTLESKSGYGLQPEAELRILEASVALGEQSSVDVATTYLGAHAFPGDVDRATYLDQVLTQIPDVAARGLAEFCDVYCDEGYFDLDESRRILEVGREHGLRPKVHLDAYSHTDAARLSIDIGAVSVDHLNYTTDEELRLLGEAGTTGVYMPCLDYSVGHPRPFDARRAVDAGLELAIATDICPGCWTTNMQLAIAMACRAGGLSVQHAVRAATFGAARSLGREDRIGSLAAGMQADVIVLDLPRYEDLAYRIGRNSVRTVVKAGEIVRDAG